MWAELAWCLPWLLPLLAAWAIAEFLPAEEPVDRMHGGGWG